MFGKLLSSAIKIITLPVDAVNIAADVAFGAGDGSKASRMSTPSPLTALEEIRDKVAEAAEEIDS